MHLARRRQHFMPGARRWSVIKSGVPITDTPHSRMADIGRRGLTDIVDPTGASDRRKTTTLPSLTRNSYTNRASLPHSDIILIIQHVTIQRRSLPAEPTGPCCIYYVQRNSRTSITAGKKTCRDKRLYSDDRDCLNPVHSDRDLRGDYLLSLLRSVVRCTLRSSAAATWFPLQSFSASSTNVCSVMVTRR